MTKGFAIGLSVALVAVGIALIVLGVNSNNSFGSQISRTFTGSPTDKTTWLLVSGIGCAALGFVSLLWSGRSKS